MGAILIVDGPRLARVFFGTRLPGLGGWVGLAGQGVTEVCRYSLRGGGGGIDPGALPWWRGGPSAVLQLLGGCGCLRAVLVNCAHFWNDFYGGVLMHRPN